MTVRVVLWLRGAVQGVGLRPGVHRAALEARVAGFVRNEGDGVRVVAEGPVGAVEGLVEAVVAVAPGAAMTRTEEAPTGAVGFRVEESAVGAAGRVSLPPDAGPCPACAAEVETPGGRRYGYPFTSCTRCGPRWSIARAAPWDRPRTAMAPFPLCPECSAEYSALDDRRAHAQTLACPACGPRLWWRGSRGAEDRAARDEAFGRAVELLRAGGVLALKGVGGWQLLVDAACEPAVAALRVRKGREAKAFAVLFADLAAVEAWCGVSAEGRRCLVDSAAPVVLLPTRVALAPSVAPSSRWTGAMLPASPLHGLLVRAFGGPLVCTSGNLSGEPLCVDDDEAITGLGGCADGWLGHDRAIVRGLDDSVVRPAAMGPVVLRRGRGLVPRALPRAEPGPAVLGVGAHLKATVTLALRDEYVVSEHVGDLGSAAALDRLASVARDLVAWTGQRPAVIACDAHPDLGSTRLAETLARQWAVPLVRVQHHAAHVAAVAAEHGLVGPVTGLAWDGMGLGEDNTLWGGELLSLEGGTARRLGHLRTFRLPGGEAAAREPARSALGLLHALGLNEAPAARHFSAGVLEVVRQALARGVNAPWTSSVGRLFEAMAVLLGVATRSRYEGEAASLLEQCCAEVADDGETWPVVLTPGPTGWVIDPGPWVRGGLAEHGAGRTAGQVAARLHATLGAAAGQWARAAGVDTLVLSGGCFANVRLREVVTAALGAIGVVALCPREMPAGDGAISLGQCAVAGRRVEGRQGA